MRTEKLYAVTENANTDYRLRFVGTRIEALGYSNRGYTEAQRDWHGVHVEELGFIPLDAKTMLSPTAKERLA